MMKSVVIGLIFVVSLGSFADSFLLGESPDWDDLRVTWGPNLFTKFTQQPRTEKAAQDEGFKLVSVGDCGENGVYNGNAYVKDDDYSLTLLYDKNGYIAGIQHGIPKNLADDKGYPSTKIQPPFAFVEGRYVLTAYFTDPSIICSEGRTKSSFDVEGTGTDLWIQTGSNSSEVTLVPKYQSGLADTKWTEGKCFYTMGKHYWYNVKDDMECDAFYPVFLLYNDGKLNGFGWALFADLSSDSYEHPGVNVIGAFMQKVPTCVSNIKTRLSTMHIYMTSTPLLNHC